MDFTPPFGQWLKARRRYLDLTQDELGRRVHYSSVLIHKIEAGEVRPSRELAAQLSTVLEVPVEDRETFLNFARGLDQLRKFNHLPVPPTPLLGRERELGALKQHLTASDTRLITLVGPPGVGKTRLAVQVARDLQREFGDGAVFVPLAPTVDPSLILTGIATALQTRPLDADPTLEAVVRFLEERHLLLLLDNCEHLLNGAAIISQLLESCPLVRMLVTSREVLRLSGEQVFEVKPLPTGPAIDLFALHAGATKPGFALTMENREIIDRICMRLDNLPLAIELAAVRSRMLTPQKMLERLNHHVGAGFDLLTGGPRDWPDRQRTLRATIDWSYDLLGWDEQRFFRRLAVFPGGCTAEAASSVCMDGGMAEDAEPLLQSLLDKSLLFEAQGLDGTARYNMLETVREYAALRLDRSGEGPEIQRRLTTYLIGLCETARPYVPKADQIEWLKRLASERDNVFAALTWSRSATGDRALGLRLAGMYGWVVNWGSSWNTYMPLADALIWAEAIETHLRAIPEEKQALTVYGVSDLVQSMGDWRAARDLTALIRDTAQRTGDWFTLLNILWGDCIAFDVMAGDFKRAEPLYEQMLADSARDPLLHAVAQAKYGRSLAANGRSDRAIPMLEKALAVWRAAGITWTMYGGTSYTQEYLARAHAWQNDFVAAQHYAERAMQDFDRVGWYLYLDSMRLAAFAALAAGSAEGFDRHAQRLLRLLPIPAVHGPTHPVAPKLAQEGTACLAHCARHALSYLRGTLTPHVWPPLLILIADENLWLGDKVFFYRLYAVAAMHLELMVDAPELRAQLAARLDDAHARALADAAALDAWRLGEGLSLNAVAALISRTAQSRSHPSL